MNIIQVFRILLKNIWLLLFSAIFMAVATFLFTKTAPLNYETEMSIYTGIASGYNLESTSTSNFDMYGSNNAFDNLINIISSRETREEVALRLLAKHLSLDKADPKYISEKNYEELIKIVPDEVKALVYKNQQKEKDETETTDASINTNSVLNDSTIQPKPVETKYHIVKYDETLFSISRMYDIPVLTLMKINNLSDNTIRPGQKIKLNLPVDTNPTANTSVSGTDENIYYIVEKAEPIESIAIKYHTSVRNIIVWNNLTERKVFIGQKLIVSKTNDEILDEDTNGFYQTAQDMIAPEHNNTTSEVGQSALEDKLSSEFDTSFAVEQTLRNLYKYKNQNDTNFIYELLNYNHKHYSLLGLSKISVERIGTSDLISISYKTNDPGICQYTMIILAKILIKNYKLIKANQSDAVVGYFEKQVQKAKLRLQKAEDELLQFNKDNNIINYDEQTKNIASRKEELDNQYQEEKMALKSTEAAIQKLENKLGTQSKINLTSEEIIKKRDEIALITTQIALKETALEENPASISEIVALKQKASKLKMELRNSLNDLYNLNNSKEGIPTKEILTQWLDNIIKYEESKARIDVFNSRRAEFEGQYSTFAPLGAKLKRIEREINVAEQEYLALLNSLNESKLKQQNIELSSNIKVIDYPYFPISPVSTKRKIMSAAAFIVGFIIVFAILLFIELIDRSIKNPFKANEYTGLQVISIMPFIPKKYKLVDFQLIRTRLIELLTQDIKLMTQGNHVKTPFYIGIVSNRDGDGKSFIAKLLKDKLSASGNKVLYFNPSLKQNFEAETNTCNYLINEKLSEIKDINEVVPEQNQVFSSQYDYYIIELPSLIMHNYPSDLVKQLNCTYLVCPASKVWTEADAKALNTFSQLLNEKPKLVLNNANFEAVESMIGEIPRKRSWLRRNIKRIFTPRYKQ